MRIDFRKKHWIALGIIILFLVGMAFLVRYVYILPVIQAKESVQMNLDAEKDIVESLRKQLREGNPAVSEISINLQKKLPVNPLIDQLLLDISRAETLSRSYVVSVNFEDVEITDISEIEKGSEEEATAEDSEENEEEQNNEKTPNTDFNVEGLRKIIASISVKALDYDQLAKFIEEVDKLPRIINIDSISFKDETGELVTVDDEVYELFFDIQLSTYYKPTLEDLKGDYPKVDYPNPAKKDNPLYEN